MTETKPLPEYLKKGIEQYKCIEHNKYSEKCHVCLNYSFIEVGLVRAWELTQERINIFNQKLELFYPESLRKTIKECFNGVFK